MTMLSIYHVYNAVILTVWNWVRYHNVKDLQSYNQSETRSAIIVGFTKMPEAVVVASYQVLIVEI